MEVIHVSCTAFYGSTHMPTRTLLLLIASLVLVTACTTTQSVLLVKPSGVKKVSSAVQMLEQGNSPEMNQNLRSALEKEGVTVKGEVPLGTQKSKEADVVVSYIDHWRWDLAMYLRALAVR